VKLRPASNPKKVEILCNRPQGELARPLGVILVALSLSRLSCVKWPLICDSKTHNLRGHAILFKHRIILPLFGLTPSIRNSKAVVNFSTHVIYYDSDILDSSSLRASVSPLSTRVYSHFEL
jgi:hypothetical protein